MLKRLARWVLRKELARLSRQVQDLDGLLLIQTEYRLKEMRAKELAERQVRQLKESLEGTWLRGY